MSSGVSYEIKKGDRLPELEVLCADRAGTAADLTGCTGALLYRKHTVSGDVETFAMSFRADRETGLVYYEWAAGETDTVGLYACEIVVTYASGEESTFPARGTFKMEILEDLEE